MEELVSSLLERNIAKLTEIIETSSFPKLIGLEHLPTLAMFLIQKAGSSSSPNTINWLYCLSQQNPEIVREVAENFGDSIDEMLKRSGDTKKLYEIKGKLSLFLQPRIEMPDVSTATPEHQNDFSEDDSEEVNYQEFSVSSS